MNSSTPQECTRRTHTVSCGWTSVHDMMSNESYIRTQRISTSKYIVACAMFCNEINRRHPCKMQSKKHLHHVVRMRSCAWCDAPGARAVFHRWISCFMVLSGYNAWIQIRVHHVVRMRSCAWCDASGARAVFHRWISCFMVLSGCKAWIQIRLHHVVRMRSCAWTNA